MSTPRVPRPLTSSDRRRNGLERTLRRAIASDNPFRETESAASGHREVRSALQPLVAAPNVNSARSFRPSSKHHVPMNGSGGWASGGTISIPGSLEGMAAGPSPLEGIPSIQSELSQQLLSAPATHDDFVPLTNAERSTILEILATASLGKTEAGGQALLLPQPPASFASSGGVRSRGTGRSVRKSTVNNGSTPPSSVAPPVIDTLDDRRTSNSLTASTRTDNSSSSRPSRQGAHASRGTHHQHHPLPTVAAVGIGRRYPTGAYVVEPATTTLDRRLAQITTDMFGRDVSHPLLSGMSPYDVLLYNEAKRRGLVRT